MADQTALDLAADRAVEAEQQGLVPALRASVEQSFESDRDAAGRASVLGRELGVDPSYAERNAKDLERLKRIEEFDFDTLEKNHPLLSDYLSDANNAKLFSDDVGVLTDIGDYMGALGAGVTSGTFGRGMSGIGGLLDEMQMGIGRAVTNVLPMDDNSKRLTKTFMGQFLNSTNLDAGGDLSMIGDALQDAGDYLRPPEERQSFGTDVAENLSQTMGNALLSVLMPPAGVALAIGGEAEQQSDQLDAAGVGEGNNTRLAAMTQAGVVSGLTEYVQGRFLLKGLGGEALGKGFNNLVERLPLALKNKWATRLADVGMAAGTEAVQENVQDFVQDLTEYMYYNQDVDFFDGWEETAALAGTSGGLARAIFMAASGIGKGGARARREDESNVKVKEQAAEMKAMAMRARESNSIQRDPVKFQELMTYLNDGQKTVYLSPDAAETFFQSEIDGTSLMSIAPDIAAKINESRVTGADVELGVDRMIGLAAQTDEYDFLFDHLRFDPDGPTVSEAGRMDEDGAAENRIREIMDEELAAMAGGEDQRGLSEVAGEIERKVYNDLLNTGKATPAAAAQQAALIRGIYETIDQRIGDAAERVGLRDKLRQRFEGLETRGPKATMRLKPDADDLTLDKVRRRLKAQRAAQAKASQPTDTDLLGDAKPKRAKSGPTPVISWLASKGGVKTGSQLAKDLAAMDITPARYPKLFRKNGTLTDLDAVSVDEFRDAFQDYDINPQVAATGSGDTDGFYIDRDWLVDQISNDTFGNGPLTRDQAARAAEDDNLDQMALYLQSLGLDPETASNRDMKAALQRYGDEANAQEMYQSGQIVTESEAFKKWFGDSKVVDAEGKPLVVYHGTNADFEAFSKDDAEANFDTAQTQLGFFLTPDKKYARKYGKKLVEAYVSLQNPKREPITMIDRIENDYNFEEAEAYVAELERAGHDGIIFDGGGFTEIVAFRPEQIKSVFNRGTFDPNDARILFQSAASLPGLRSALVDAANGLKQEKGTGAQMLGILKNTPGVKEDEIAWTGLDEFLKGKTSVTKVEIADFLAENQVMMEEITLGGKTYRFGSTADYVAEINRLAKAGKIDESEALTLEMEEFDLGGDSSLGQTKFSQYTLPGGKNYREVLLALPNRADKLDARRKEIEAIGRDATAEQKQEWADIMNRLQPDNRDIEGGVRFRGMPDYRSSHFDQPNILSHIRLNDRTDADGKKVLFIEEIQSDWHQAGRKKGYKSPELEQAYAAALQQAEDFDAEMSAKYGRAYWSKATAAEKARHGELYGRAADLGGSAKKGVPDAPFKKTWHEMAFRKVVQMAAQQGYDRVAWTTGEVQNDRYDLSKKVSKITWDRSTNDLRAYGLDGAEILQHSVDENGLEEVVGKDVSERLLKNQVSGTQGKEVYSLEGDTLKLGGSGMKGFYDNILVKYAQKFGKKFGATVGVTKIADGKGGVSSIEEGRALAEVEGLDDNDLFGTAHAIDITPEMKRTALESGFELFQGNRASIVFTPDGRSLIQMMETADRTSWLHENGHFFLEIMRDIYRDPVAPQQLKDDWDGTMAWLAQNKAQVFKEALGQSVYEVKRQDNGMWTVTGFDGSRDAFVGEADAKADAEAKNAAARAELTARGVDYLDVFLNGYQPQDAADFLLYRATHEQFARGFEAYLFKGEAPSAEMRSMFETFKAWLQRAYRYAIENLNVKVSPELTAIFDRLIATDDAIEAYRSESVAAANPQTLEMLTEAERRDYIKLNERRIQNAKNKLFRKAMRQHEREETAWYKEEREKVEAEQAAIVDASPLYRAVRFFATGEDAQGEKTTGDHKLSRKVISSVFGEETLKYLPKGITTAKGGLDPAVAADLFGYQSADRLIGAMMGMESRKEAIQRRTDDEMVKRYGDMLTDGTIERQALESLMRESPIAQAYELKALSKKTGVEYPSDGDFKKAAARLLAGKKVDEAIKPDGYYRAARRAAREYGRFVATKNYDKAAAAKRREILNHHLFKQSAEARDAVQKALKRFAKLSKKPAKGKRLTIDPDYRDKILELLGSVSLSPRLSAARRTRLELAAINQFVKAKQEDDNAQLIVPPELLAADGVQHYRDMELAEFTAFRDLIYNIERQGRKKLQLVVNGKKRILAADAAEAAEIIRANNKLMSRSVDPDRMDDRNVLTRAASMARFMVGITKKAETLIEELDGGKTKGFIWERTRGPIFEGEIKEQEMRSEAAEKLAAINFKHYGKKKITLPGGKPYYVTSEDLVSPKSAVFINDGVGSLTREVIIMVAANTRNADNKQKLLDGSKHYSTSKYQWTEEDLDQILAKMRKQDWEYVTDVGNLFDEYWPQIEQLERERRGYAPEKVTGDPIETPHGVFPGGYWRIKYNGRIASGVKENDAEAETGAFMRGRFASTQTRTGSAIERTQSAGLPIKLNLSVISAHLNEVIHDIALGEAVVNVNKFLNHPDTQAAIEDTKGVEGFESLQVWLADIAAGGLRASDKADTLQAGLRHSLTMGSLMLKAKTALLQFTGFTQSIVEIRPKYAAKGLARYMQLGGPLGAGNYIMAQSRYMNERPAVITRDTAAALRRLEKNGWLSDLQSLALAPMLRFQFVVDQITYLGAYEKAVAEGRSGDDAIRYAELMVDRAQGSAFISALSAPERGTTSKGNRLKETIKTLTMFMSYFNAKLNIAMRRTRGTDFRNPAQVASLAGDYMLLFWAEFIIGEAIMGAMPDFDDEDDPLLSFFVWSMGGALQTAASGMIFLRDIVGAIEGFGGGSATGRGLEGIGQATATIGREIGDLFAGEEVNGYKIAKAGITLTNFASPVKIPASQMNTVLSAMDEASEGGEVTPMDYLRYNPNK